ncbi:MAG: class I SAM-dependent methyltransferase [Candidatus Helarchaeota archaeon]
MKKYNGIKKKDIKSKYDQTADHYDLRYENIQKAKFNALFYELKKIYDFQNKEIILDIGCGTLIVYEQFLSKLGHNFYYIGLDFSIMMLKEGINKNQVKLRHNNYSTILADVEYLPLKSEKINICVSLTVAQNLIDIEKHLTIIFDILDKNNGVLLISFHKKFFTLKYVENLLKKIQKIDYIHVNSENLEDYLFIIRKLH